MAQISKFCETRDGHKKINLQPYWLLMPSGINRPRSRSPSTIICS